jgi:SpoVK/Ycf46/Vps4 family AAA+-type ATPase
MKNSLVGESGKQTRRALQVIESISKGRVLFVATCNAITTLPPELRRRFNFGTFFFDLPTKSERDIIWKIYLKKYNISNPIIPKDSGWTGAEIRTCCKLSSQLNISLIDAAKYIVPVSQSAPEQIESLRRLASGRFISASQEGVYTKTEQPEQPGGRKLQNDSI